MTKLEVLCEEFLTAQQATLWGRPWDIISPDGRREAARWLAQQVRGVVEVQRQHDGH